MNRKGHGRKQSCPIPGTITAFAWKDSGKPQKAQSGSASSQDSNGRTHTKNKPEASLLDNGNYDGLDIQHMDVTWKISDRRCIETYLGIIIKHSVC